jgi:thymidylate synthase
MKTKEIVYMGGDVHIYKNHIDQMKEQISRTPRPFPKIHLDPRIEHINWEYIKYSDFELIGYFPYKKLFAPMAV